MTSIWPPWPIPSLCTTPPKNPIERQVGASADAPTVTPLSNIDFERNFSGVRHYKYAVPSFCLITIIIIYNGN